MRYDELPALLESGLRGESWTYTFDTGKISVLVTTRYPRWWGRLILRVTDWLTEIAYRGADERTEERWIPKIPGAERTKNEESCA